MKSVGNVLHRMRDKGVSEERWSALQARWNAVSRHGPVGPTQSQERPWIPDLHGFCDWVLDASVILEYLVRSSASGMSCWIRDDFAPTCTSGFAWMLVPLAPRIGVQARNFPHGTGIFVQPSLTDAHFRMTWIPFFRRKGHPVVIPHAFLKCVGVQLRQAAF